MEVQTFSGQVLKKRKRKLRVNRKSLTDSIGNQFFAYGLNASAAMRDFIALGLSTAVISKVDETLDPETELFL